jgi:hypothetical protein
VLKNKRNPASYKLQVGKDLSLEATRIRKEPVSYLKKVQPQSRPKKGIFDNMACLLKARIVMPAETAVAGEQLCKYAHC